jgi:hypothetical protein
LLEPIPALLTVFIAGVLGGLVYELTNLSGRLELPQLRNTFRSDEPVSVPPAADVGVDDQIAHPAFLIDLGVFARLFVGGMSGIALLGLTTPPTVIKLVAAGLIAGSAGTAVFDAYRKALKSALARVQAQEQIIEVTGLAARQEESLRKLDKAMRGLSANSVALTAMTPNGDGARELSSEAGADGALASVTQELADAQQLLGEARGLNEAILHRR